MGRFTGVIGIVVLLGLAFVFSSNRRAIRPRTVVTGLGLQILFAFLVLKFEYGRRALTVAGEAVNRLLSYSFAGSQFVFGELGVKHSKYGFDFAFQVLPTIIFIAAFFAILYHYGVMQFIIRIAARIMTRLMGASGVESLNVAASIFMGQTEAPLTIRPFLPERDAIGADGDHDRRHGARLRRHHGRLHSQRSRGQAPAHSRHHDRARNHPAGQNAGA